MDKYDKLVEKEQFFKHPYEPIVLRTVPTGEWVEFFARFSGGAEYQPDPGGNMVNDAIFMNEPDWITKDEYYNF